MAQKIRDHVIWYEHAQVLVLFKPAWNSFSHKTICEHAHLILVAHTTIPHRLCVVKNREIKLDDQSHRLKDIFTDYQIVDDGWRGAIQLSQAEWVHHMLTWS